MVWDHVYSSGVGVGVNGPVPRGGITVGVGSVGPFPRCSEDGATVGAGVAVTGPFPLSGGVGITVGVGSVGPFPRSSEDGPMVGVGVAVGAYVGTASTPLSLPLPFCTINPPVTASTQNRTATTATARPGFL